MQLGAKRAPNFNGQLRRLVYRCYEAYEAVKALRSVPGRGPGWDRADLAAALYRNLRAGQYRGVRLDGIYRDEVQDFTQVGAGGGVDCGVEIQILVWWLVHLC